MFQCLKESYAKNTKMQINSALNLKTKDLNVLGVPEIILSDSQKVYMFPTGGRIVIKKNRTTKPIIIRSITIFFDFLLW